MSPPRAVEGIESRFGTHPQASADVLDDGVDRYDWSVVASGEFSNGFIEDAVNAAFASEADPQAAIARYVQRLDGSAEFRIEPQCAPGHKADAVESIQPNLCAEPQAPVAILGECVNSAVGSAVSRTPGCSSILARHAARIR